MIFKRRWFRILAGILATVLFFGYFAFSTFLFAPHEADWEFDVAALIPRDVDFFVAKARLEDDFDELPRLAAMDEIERLEAWQMLEASPEFGQWKEEQRVDEQLAELEAALDRIPLGLDPLAIFGGEDLAFAGRFQGAAIELADWAVYGHVNWAGKLAVAALGFPGLAGLEAQGISVERTGRVYHLTGGTLERPLFVTRVRDVVVVGTSAELAEQAQELAARSGEGSLFLSADYGDNIDALPSRSPRRDEVEVIVDLRALLTNLGLTSDPLPNTRSERFLPAFLGRIFQAQACKKVMGVIGFDEGVQIDLYGGFSSELITADQRRIYSRPGFSHADVMHDIASLAPADTVLFAYLEGPIDVLLKQVLESLEPALRSNLEDTFRSTGQWESLEEVVADMSAALHDHLALVVREHDYRGEPDGPPHDGRPVFAVALVTWHSDEGMLVELRDHIGHNASKFGLKGRGDEAGYYKYSIANYETREFWSEFVPGTGVVATMNTNEHCYITNVHEMLRQLLKTYLQDDSGYPRLSDRPDFQALLSSMIPSANMLVWVNPRPAEKTLRAQARVWAEENAARGVDWTRLRREEEQKVLPQVFPGRSRSSLTEEEASQLDAAIDPVLRQRREELMESAAPQLQAAKDRQIAYGQSVSAFLAMLQLEPRSFRLSLRMVTPLEE